MKSEITEKDPQSGALKSLKTVSKRDPGKVRFGSLFGDPKTYPKIIKNGADMARL